MATKSPTQQCHLDSEMAVAPTHVRHASVPTRCQVLQPSSEHPQHGSIFKQKLPSLAHDLRSCWFSKAAGDAVLRSGSPVFLRQQELNGLPARILENRSCFTSGRCDEYRECKDTHVSVLSSLKSVGALFPLLRLLEVLPGSPRSQGWSMPQSRSGALVL